VVSPSIKGGRGKGSERIYKYGDLVALRAVALFRGAGVALGSLKNVATWLKRLPPAYEAPPPAKMILLVSPDGVVHEYHDTDGILTAAMKGIGQPCMLVVSVEELGGQVTADATELQLMGEEAAPRRGRPKKAKRNQRIRGANIKGERHARRSKRGDK